MTINVINQDGTVVESGTTSQIKSWKPDQKVVVKVYFGKDLGDLNNYKLEFIPQYQSGTYHKP